MTWKQRTFDTVLVLAAIGIVAYGFATGGLQLASAHSPDKCFESTRCKYVQIETEHGAQRMVYICE